MTSVLNAALARNTRYGFPPHSTHTESSNLKFIVLPETLSDK